MAAVRFVKVRGSAQEPPVLLPLKNNALTLETVQSQFQDAAGLRAGNRAVGLNGGVFEEPASGWDTTFDIVRRTASQAIGNVRALLNSGRSNRLPNELANSFNQPSTSGLASGFSPHSAAAYANEKRVGLGRTTGVVKRKRPSVFTVKVAFVTKCSLPVAVSKGVVLFESMIDLNSSDSEASVRQKLVDILITKEEYRCIAQQQLVFLSYSAKELSLPIVAEGYEWTGSRLKASIGQGRLYIQIQCDDSVEQELPDLVDIDTNMDRPSASSEEPTVTAQNDNEVEEMNFQELEDRAVPDDTGTPTITFRGNRRSLSLRRRPTERQATVGNNSYRSYLSLFSDEVLTISDDSDTDTDNANFQDNGCNNSETTITEVLVTLRSTLNTEESSRFNISRTDVMDGARRAINRKSFNPRKKISVRFSDDCGTSEGAIDEGGPTRELLRMLLGKVQQLNIFDGPENSRLLRLDSAALADGLYRDVGVIISLSLVHGGPAPKFFSKLLYHSLAFGVSKSTVKATVEDVQDRDLRDQIHQLMTATESQQIEKQLETMSPLLMVAGCYRPVRSKDQKDRVVEDLLNFLVLGKNSEALSELATGMETLGLLQKIKEHPLLFEELFTYSDRRLSAEVMEVVFHDIKYSVNGSNKKQSEERIIGYWRDFLLDIEEQDEAETKVTLRDILIFATGADEVPPLGFDPLPSISFLHGHQEIFPKANTCGMVLSLPITDSYAKFKENMLFGVGNSPGFGRA